MAWKASINKVDRGADKLVITVKYSDGIHEPIRELVESPKVMSDDWLQKIMENRLKELDSVDVVEASISQDKVNQKIYELHPDTKEITYTTKPLEPVLEEVQEEIK